MELFKLEKPDLSAIDIAKLFKSYSLNHADEYTDSVYKASEPLYYYWDSIKHRQPPKGLTSLEYWGLIKHIRRLSSRKTYIKLAIKGGEANPAPPVGTALGPHGLPIMEFVKA